MPKPPLTEREDIIRTLLAEGLRFRKGKKHDHMVGSFRGREVLPIQIPNQHSKGEKFSDRHDGVKKIWKKLGISKVEWYELVGRYS